MMSEDLNLPASLERLEINPERVEGCKNEQSHFQLPFTLSVVPECNLQTLSLKAECPKGNCLCNKKKDKEVIMKRVTFKRPILRRSKLNRVALLRAPVLNIKEHCSKCNAMAVSSAICTSVTCCCHSAPTKCACLKHDHSPPLRPVVTTCSTTHDSSSSVLGGLDYNGRGEREEEQRKKIKCSGTFALTSGTGSLCSVQARMSPPLTSSPTSSSSPPLHWRNSAAATGNSSPSSSTVTDDDTTIDELASYFDLFVHIPKKMSLMAEMMYI